MIARASAARLIMPPESWLGQQLVDVAQPDGLEPIVHLGGDLGLGWSARARAAETPGCRRRQRVEQRAALEHHAELAPHADTSASPTGA